MTELSVVLISKNQEWNIARLVESVLRETNSLPSREIILVDSASTDRTTAIAAHYPIRVLKLCPDQRLTAAAGRHVGYKHTTGDFVLFLDGDMELYRGWLQSALEVMGSRSDVAVVCGRVIDRPKSNSTAALDSNEQVGPDAQAIEVTHGGGAAMYRRSVLEQVGSFNPYLYSDEEPELCLRIRHTGYRILRLPRPIVLHYSPPAEAFSTVLGRRNRNLWLGYGQNLRYFFHSPLLWAYLKERGWALAPALALGLGLVALMVSLFTAQWGWLALWAGGMILVTLAIAIRKRSLKRAFFSLFQRLLVLEGTLRGLLFAPYDPAAYPGRYDVIK